MFGKPREVSVIVWGFTERDADAALTRVRDEAGFHGWLVTAVRRVVGGRASDALAGVSMTYPLRRGQTYGRAFLVYESAADGHVG